MSTQHVEISASDRSDISKLQSLERSAGELFRTVQGLEWIADDDILSSAEHENAIAEGMSFKAMSLGENGHSRIIAGFICAQLLSGTLHIGELSVGSEWQGRGIGRALVMHVVNKAIMLDTLEVTLTTFRKIAWNEPFYRKLGFETLADNQLTQQLRDILEEEVAHGFSREQRCAMRLILPRV